VMCGRAAGTEVFERATPHIGGLRITARHCAGKP
jgi:hypothetical protein